MFARSCLLVAPLLLAVACQRAPVLPSIDQSVTDASRLTEAASLAATCSGCHAGPGTGVPSIDRMDAGTLSARLAFYKTDADGTTVMHRIARGYSQAQVDAIGQYLGAESIDE
ncbi:c-type cytochrome [Hyphomonas sp.]|jgi:sulfide dehydrogenase cytochrome subunit|uniref:c-type cytochrome n=1 Tax=Hyphomonas sp. TaxID=87 RepID=UPI0039E2F6CA